MSCTPTHHAGCMRMAARSQLYCWQVLLHRARACRKHHAQVMLAQPPTIQGFVHHAVIMTPNMRHVLHLEPPFTALYNSVHSSNWLHAIYAVVIHQRGRSSLNCCRLDTRRAHSKGRMAASVAGGRLAVSSRPEAADKGPQAASRSLMVLLGDTPCNKSSWLPPPCSYTQAYATVSELLAANHMACGLHWDATIALTVSHVPFECAKLAEGLEKQSSGGATWPKRCGCYWPQALLWRCCLRPLPQSNQLY